MISRACRRLCRFVAPSTSAVAGLRPTLLLVVCLVPATAAADIDYLVERPLITVSLDYQDKEENRSGPSVDARSEHMESFRQRLEVQSRGWLYHPDLLLFSFRLEPQWKQQNTLASDMFERDDDDVFLGYYIDAQVLRQKLHSFRFFLRQSRNEFNSTLSPDNVTDTDIARAVWNFNHATLPTTVTLESNNTSFADFFSTRDDSEILRLQTKFRSEKHQFNLLSEYVNQFRRIDVQSFDIDRFMTNANSNYFFSDDTRLTSTIFALNSNSELSDNRSLLWSERLMLQHSPDLRSEYTARFDSRENENFRTETRFLSAALEHHLYENLTTRFELFSSNNEFNNGAIDTGQADLDLQYVREVPIGMLSVNAGYAYRVEDNDIDAASSQVLNEPVRLSGTSPEFLSRPNVDVDSVIVSDATQAVTYVEGLDYVLTVVGDSVGIERTLFGGIADEETVLVDYVFATQAPFESDRRAGRFGVNLNLWRVLRLYYNFNRIEERLLSGIRPADLSDDRIKRAGASLRWRWSTTSADYEDRDTVRTPLTRKRLQQSFMFRINQSLSVGLSASYSETTFRDTGNDSRALGYGGNLRWIMGRWGRFEINAFSRDVDGESQRTRSKGLISKWSIRYGDWSGHIGFETLDESDDISVQTRDRRLTTLYISRIFR